MEQMRSRTSLIGAMLLRRGDADAMLCGTVGDYLDHLKFVRRVIGLKRGVHTVATMQLLILNDRQLFFCDTHVNRDPDAEQIAEMTLLAAEQVRRFGMTPRRRAAVAFELRQLGRALGAEDARGAGADPRPRCRPGSGRRDARRLGAVERHPRQRVSRLAPASTMPTC